MCMKCLHPSMVHSPAHSDSCQVVVDYKANKKKAKYTCSVDSCNYNYWVFNLHKLDNKNILDEIRSYQKTKGLTMGSHERLNVGRTVSENLPGSLQVTPEVPITAAHGKCNHPEVQNQVEELFRAMEDQGVEVVAKPKERPIFMFFPVAGTNKPVLTFFDSGYSDAVVREGIPGVEWRGCITQ